MLSFYLSILEDQEDKSFFEEIYIQYRQKMFYIAQSILHDEGMAEDAVHESFIKIANNIKKIKDENCHKIKAYIVIVTENTSINMYNKKKRQVTDDIEDYTYNLSSSENDESSVLDK